MRRARGRGVYADNGYRVSPAASQLEPFELRLTSQNGEDGILAELFKRIGPDYGFFVEIGAGDGVECNCGNLARRFGWSGLMIEGDEGQYARLRSTVKKLPRVQTASELVSVDNACELLRRHGVATELDLLSIDIDGNDYWIWRALSEFRSRVVVIEYNAYYPPPAHCTIKYNSNHRWDVTTYYGASLAALEALGDSLGYALVGTESRGINAFFVRNDLLIKSGFSRLSAADAYRPPGFGLLASYPYRAGDWLEV